MDDFADTAGADAVAIFNARFYALPWTYYFGILAALFAVSLKFFAKTKHVERELPTATAADPE